MPVVPTFVKYRQVLTTQFEYEARLSYMRDHHHHYPTSTRTMHSKIVLYDTGEPQVINTG